METPHTLQIVLRAYAGVSNETFAARVWDELLPRLQASGPTKLVAYVSIVPPRLSVVPFRREPIALFQLGAECERQEHFRALLAAGGRAEAYRVELAVPLARPRDWPLGHRTPGATLLTLFRRRPGLDDALFFERWFEEHTPLSLRDHPLCSYARGRVVAPLGEGIPLWDGIVTEQVRERRDLLAPWRFFGGRLATMPRTMWRVWRHVRSFIDLHTLESYLVDELRLRGDDP